MRKEVPHKMNTQSTERENATHRWPRVYLPLNPESHRAVLSSAHPYIPPLAFYHSITLYLDSFFPRLLHIRLHLRTELAIKKRKATTFDDRIRKIKCPSANRTW
jgi:hypothetical protein